MQPESSYKAYKNNVNAKAAENANPNHTVPDISKAEDRA